MKTSSSFGLAFATAALGLTALVIACGGAESVDVLGAPGASTGTSGTSTSGETSTSGATSGVTSSGATSSGTSGVTSSTTSSGSTSGCFQCDGPPAPPGCTYLPCSCNYTCVDAGGPLKCTWTPDGSGGCPDGSYCDAPDCLAGVCVKKAEQAGPDRNPQCGCNGVTYWNGGLAKKAGMAIRANGACSPLYAKSCTAASGCPAGGSCNLQVPKKSECNGGNSGVCWVLPAQCPIAIGGRSRPCGAAALACNDECSAIKKQSQWFDDGSCPQ